MSEKNINHYFHDKFTRNNHFKPLQTKLNSFNKSHKIFLLLHKCGIKSNSNSSQLIGINQKNQLLEINNLKRNYNLDETKKLSSNKSFEHFNLKKSKLDISTEINIHTESNEKSNKRNNWDESTDNLLTIKDVAPPLIKKEEKENNNGTFLNDDYYYSKFKQKKYSFLKNQQQLDFKNGTFGEKEFKKILITNSNNISFKKYNRNFIPKSVEKLIKTKQSNPNIFNLEGHDLNFYGLQFNKEVIFDKESKGFSYLTKNKSFSNKSDTNILIKNRSEKSNCILTQYNRELSFLKGNNEIKNNCTKRIRNNSSFY
jgi:hypothetical protein